MSADEVSGEHSVPLRLSFFFIDAQRRGRAFFQPAQGPRFLNNLNSQRTFRGKVLSVLRVERAFPYPVY